MSALRGHNTLKILAHKFTESNIHGMYKRF